MVKIQHFEDLVAWKKARELAVVIYSLTNKDPFSNDFGLKQQIQKAASSIMHNIAEGFDSGTDPEFARFLKIARRSTSEVQSELYLALDLGYITAIEEQETQRLAIEVKKLVNGLLSYLHQDHLYEGKSIADQEGLYTRDDT